MAEENKEGNENEDDVGTVEDKHIPHAPNA
jgi:hypothetical protein